MINIGKPKTCSPRTVWPQRSKGCEVQGPSKGYLELVGGCESRQRGLGGVRLRASNGVEAEPPNLKLL